MDDSMERQAPNQCVSFNPKFVFLPTHRHPAHWMCPCLMFALERHQLRDRGIHRTSQTLLCKGLWPCDAKGTGYDKRNLRKPGPVLIENIRVCDTLQPCFPPAIARIS